MVIQRWDPVRELRQMDETMNRLWRGMGGTASGGEDWNIALDVVQQADDIVVKASVPGIAPETIEVDIEDNVLTIRAERKADFTDEKSVYLIRERPVGNFYRALRLPETIDVNQVHSAYENGILTIFLPKAEERKKKKINIQVTGAPRVIDTRKEK